jgi:Tfp pilus assembly protein PilV
MRRRKGVILVVVLVTLVLVAAAVTSLAAIGASVQFDTDRARAAAVERNALASAIAWATAHEVPVSPAAPATLPAADLLGAGGVLSVVRDGNASALVVRAHFRSGRFGVDHTRTFAGEKK